MSRGVYTEVIDREREELELYRRQARQLPTITNVISSTASPYANGNRTIYLLDYVDEDYLMKEIRAKWRAHYDSLGGVERLPYFIGLTVVLWDLLCYFASINLRRRPDDQVASSS